MKRLLEFFSPDRATLICFLLFLACVPFFVYCRIHHFTVFGHEYAVTFLDKANDVAWRSGFFIAMILIFWSEIKFRYAFIFAMGVGFLQIASPLNFFGILILPVAGALCLFALAGLLGWIE
jgi:hypothetical protein